MSNELFRTLSPCVAGEHSGVRFVDLQSDGHTVARKSVLTQRLDTQRLDTRGGVGCR